MTIAAELSSRLQDPSLVREAAFIAGEWISSASSEKTFAVNNPADGATLALVPQVDLTGIQAAIDAAHASQKEWARRSAEERSKVLRAWYDLVVRNLDDLATILTAEMGKPFAEAQGEVLYGASYVEWYAEEAKRLYGDVIPGHGPDKRILVVRQPVGVVAGITAWNFPAAMPLRKISPAIAAGCAIVFKPADLTPLSALALAVLAERAGVPKGLLSVVTTQDAPAFGREVCQNEKVRKITFTGSTNVGRTLMRQASEQITKLSLELGGNAPFIVFDDANMDEAVEGVVTSKFRNAGQTCVCANRIYVQSRIYDDFSSRLADRARSLKVGDGFSPGVEVGPLINRAAVDKVERHIADGKEKGGMVQAGGHGLNSGDLFFAPTVLTNANSTMLVAREETFGPLAPIFRFRDADDVITQANDTEFGLAAYFYTNDVRRVWRVAEALEYGMVGVNTGLISTAVAPFGGIKQSGIGREGSKYGLDDFTEMKYICLGEIPY
jgi:succinate-semialdehyde dehydrogenase / glutarate-semialdehyde dehydrogenase